MSGIGQGCPAVTSAHRLVKLEHMMLFPGTEPQKTRIAATGLVLAAATLLFSSCSFDIEIGDDDLMGSGEIITRTIEVDSSFDVVEIADSFDAIIEVGPEPSVVVQAHDNFFDHMVVEVRGGQLIVESKNVSFDGIANVTITMRSLRELEVSGASSAKILGAVNSENLGIDVSGASEVTFERVNAAEVDLDISGASEVELDKIAAEKISLTVAGASDVTASGQAGEAVLDVSGSSDVTFADLIIDDAQVSLSGASDVDLRGAANIAGELSGTSNMKVAKSVGLNVDMSGLSEIND